MPIWLRILLIQLRDVLIVFAISTFVTFFFVGPELFSSFHNLINISFYGTVVGLTLWKGSSLLGNVIERFFPWEKMPTRALVVTITSSVLYCTLAIIVVNVLFYKYIFNVSIRSEFNQILLQMIVQLGIALLITTIFYVREFFMFWRKAAVNEERYKREALALQFETLKSQVNPHFLFNSLSVLSSLVEKDVAKSQLFIRQLSDIYRYVLEYKSKELVPLEKELSFAKSYIELHRIRHGENLQIDWQVLNHAGYTVPLSMQVLLENAFKHNVISAEEPLTIKIWRDHDYIVVQNRLQKRTTVKSESGIGLETIGRQFEYLSSKSLLICDDDGYFTVHVPVLTSDELPETV
ncbi:MAG: histidine kinase [Bacteroidales bacterium]|nr:histidine kinase [Bacteroidales bacterium]